MALVDGDIWTVWIPILFHELRDFLDLFCWTMLWFLRWSLSWSFVKAKITPEMETLFLLQKLKLFLLKEIWIQKYGYPKMDGL